MSFFRPPSNLAMRFRMKVTVAYGHRWSKSKGEQRKLEIRIGDGVLAALGWQVGQRFEILWGHGPDAQRICLMRSDAGRKLVRRCRLGQHASATITWANVPHSEISDEHGALWRFVDETRKATEVKQLHLPDGRLGLELPSDWFACVRPAKKFHLAS